MQNSDYLRLFLDEAEEIINRLTGNLVLLEKNPEEPRIINEVFRDAHTVKGSAGAMGFTQMAEVAHQMESVLSCLRQRQVHPTPLLFSALLSGLDMIRQIKHDVYASGVERAYNISSVVSALTQFLQAQAQVAVAMPATVMPTAMVQNLPRHRVEITLRAGTVMKSARSYVILQGLKQLGSIVKCEPSESDLIAERFDLRFVVELATEDSPDNVVAFLGQDGDIEDVKLQTVRTETAAKAMLGQAPAELRLVANQHSVRVDVKKLEALMNLVGELVIERNRLATIAGIMERQNKEDASVRTLMAVSGQLGRITGDLQLEIMKARMIPISQLFSTFPRLVRDLSQGLSKQIELHLEGNETELDRTIVEEIRDPLIHIVRNAVDHGIDLPADRLAAGKSAVGNITLRATHEENNVVITISDDGRGIDGQAVSRKAIAMGLITEDQMNAMTAEQVNQLILLPGLSTASKVTDVSGRGVGMDIVKNQLEKLGGSVEITSKVGSGTEFIIRLPLTLAIIRALLVRACDRDYAVPIASVSETKRMHSVEIKTVQGHECIVVREQIIPLVGLHQVLELGKPAEAPSNLVVAASGNTKVGLLVDRLLGEQEIVIKPLGPFFHYNREFAGATILGDGRVVPIIDVKGLFDLINKK
ncbi:MAG: chemotaxis protein CheA [Bacillota bacterium]|nr:chemotaxis protein CheA [Bacillota bacterium]